MLDPVLVSKVGPLEFPNEEMPGRRPSPAYPVASRMPPGDMGSFSILAPVAR